MKSLQAAAWAALLAAGCSINGDLDEKDRNKDVACTDTRDGEVFQFNTSSMSNIRVGIGAPSSFDVVTTGGRQMTLIGNMAAWLKCEISAPRD